MLLGEDNISPSLDVRDVCEHLLSSEAFQAIVENSISRAFQASCVRSRSESPEKVFESTTDSPIAQETQALALEQAKESRKRRAGDDPVSAERLDPPKRANIEENRSRSSSDAFDPSVEAIANQEHVYTAPESISKYVSTYLTKGLDSTEWKAMKKACPHQYPCFAGARSRQLHDRVRRPSDFPKALEKELRKIQSAVSLAADPLIHL